MPWLRKSVPAAVAKHSGGGQEAAEKSRMPAELVPLVRCVCSWKSVCAAVAKHSGGGQEAAQKSREPAELVPLVRCVCSRPTLDTASC